MNDSKIVFSESERLDWLRLIRSENVGPRTFYRLLERFGTARAALGALPALAKKGGRSKPITICPLAAAKAELDQAARLGFAVMCRDERGYPSHLAQIDDAPPVLYVAGNPSLLLRPMVALVGARNASVNGRNLARRLAMDLGRSGLVVVSGLARGIDTAAHEGAMAGGTVAVMAGGLDVVYPQENQRLYDEIRRLGVAVSEMPPGTQPQASHFPRRNRIVSGLSLGTVVLEASLRSGSLITARMAADQGREVFAVPGHPSDPRAGGPNDLIKTGAHLVEGADDVMAVLRPHLQRPLAEPKYNEFKGKTIDPIPDGVLDRARVGIVESLGPSPVTVDLLIRECQLSASVVSVVLLELELAGRLERHHGNQVSLLSDL